MTTVEPIRVYTPNPDLSEAKNRERALEFYLAGLPDRTPVVDPINQTVWYASGVWVDLTGFVHAPSVSPAQRLKDIHFYWAQRARVARQQHDDARKDLEGRIHEAKVANNPRLTPSAEYAAKVAELKFRADRLAEVAAEAARAAGLVPTRQELDEREARRVQIEREVADLLRLANS